MKGMPMRAGATKGHDLGEDRDEKYGAPEVATKKGGKVYPTLELSDEQFPALKGKQVGDLCQMDMTAHCVGMDKRDGKAGRYTLELRKASMGKGGK